LLVLVLGLASDFRVFLGLFLFRFFGKLDPTIPFSTCSLSQHLDLSMSFASLTEDEGPNSFLFNS